MRSGLLGFTTAMTVAAAATACAPVQTYNGYPIETAATAPQSPQVGVDTRDTIRQRFGTPSTTSVLDQNAWYYVSEIQSQVAFYTPHITDRRVMVVRFEGDTVSAVENYGIERGRIIAYDTHVTPTRGRELGILEQLLGNIGSSVPLPPDQQQGGRPPNR
ncbi:MAG: outer membrane protein assembly factor BamE [Proteobacteria bacterium]|nr:outer membrane protein assembly factor BamE [Pseudomonadota bacterium]